MPDDPHDIQRGGKPRAPAAGRFLSATAHEQLDELATLNENWDSYGGSPPTQTSIAEAHELLSKIETLLGPSAGKRVRPFDVAPIPRGGVQIEWRGGDLHLEVEIGPDGDLSYLLKKIRPTGREYEEAHDVESTSVLNELKRVLSA
jgi:hypothetical protein